MIELEPVGRDRKTERSTKHLLCTAYEWWFALYCKAQSCFWQGPPVYNSQVKMSELVFLELPFVHSKRFWLGMHSLDSIVQNFFLSLFILSIFPIFCLLFWWLTEHLNFRRNRKCWIIQYSCSFNWISIFFIFIFPLCVCVRCFSFVYSTFWLTIRISVMSLLYKWSWWWWWFEPLQTKRIRI